MPTRANSRQPSPNALLPKLTSNAVIQNHRQTTPITNRQGLTNYRIYVVKEILRGLIWMFDFTPHVMIPAVRIDYNPKRSFLAFVLPNQSTLAMIIVYLIED